MNPCPEKEALLHGLMDGELDAAHSVDLEGHLKTCRGCADELRRLEAVRRLLATHVVRYRAPEALRRRVLKATEHRVIGTPSRRSWFAGVTVAALAAGLVLALAGPYRATDQIPDEIVSSHVRSLLADHLTDVTTSNQHVVKPWFNGRIDFAFPVIDLEAQGFPLVGGRLDYIGSRLVPALVYRRNLHTVNLFIWPSTSSSSTVRTAVRRGHNLVSWTRAGLEFWAISDLNAEELILFQREVAGRTTP